MGAESSTTKHLVFKKENSLPFHWNLIRLYEKRIEGDDLQILRSLKWAVFVLLQTIRAMMDAKSSTGMHLIEVVPDVGLSILLQAAAVSRIRAQ